MSAARWNRKLHRVGAMLIALPLLVVIGTGMLLLLKKDIGWIHPPTRRGATTELEVSFEEILAAARSVPEAGIQSWDDVDRLDVRPGKGIVKVRGVNRWEVQVDASSGQVVQTAYRRSDLIESLHDGSWFHERAKLALFLPMALILLGLWCTGIYLFFLPHLVRRRRKVQA